MKYTITAGIFVGILITLSAQFAERSYRRMICTDVLRNAEVTEWENSKSCSEFLFK